MTTVATRRLSLIVPAILSLAVSGLWAEEGQPKEAPPTGLTAEQLKAFEEFKKRSNEISPELQKKIIEAEAYFVEARAMFVQQKNAEARDLVEKALRAYPDHPGAKDLHSRVLAVLGARDDMLRQATEYFGYLQNLRAQETSVRLGALYEKAKAKRAAGDYAGADRDLDTIYVGLLAFPNQFDWGTFPAAVQKERDEVAALSRDANLARAAKNREDAIKEVKNRADAVERALSEKVDMLMRRALAAYERDDFRRSEIDAWNAYELDRRREDARDLYLKARRTAHERFDDQYREIREEALAKTHEQIHRDLIPAIDVLVYPEDWSRRTLRKPVEIGSSQEDASMANLRDKLQMRVTLEFDERPFDEVVEHLRKVTGVNILVDPKVTSGAVPPVSIKLPKEVSLANALSWIMQQTQLNYALDNQAIFISKEAVGGATKTQIYDVADLIGAPPDFRSPLAEQTYLPLSTGSGAGAGAAPPSLFGNNNAGAAAGTGTGVTIEQINKQIQDNTANKNWDAAKGYGSTPVGTTRLIVTHTDAVHREIAALLEHRRSIGNLMVDTKINLVDVRKNFFEEIGFRIINPQTSFLAGSTTNGYDRVSNNGSWMLGATNETIPLPSNRTQANYSQNVGTPAEKGLNIDFAHGAGAFASGLFGIDELHAMFTAVQDDSDMTFSRKTTLTCHNGQQAYALFIRQFAYIAGYSTSGGQFDPIIQIINLGERIQVRPIVSADRKYVTLELEPSSIELKDLFTVVISAVQSIRSGNTTVTFTADFPLELPNVEIRALKTSVMIPDKGSMIIGGYTGSVRQQTHTGVPFLSHIPFLGRLFSRNGIYDENRRLYWLLSVEILDLQERESMQ